MKKTLFLSLGLLLFASGAVQAKSLKLTPVAVPAGGGCDFGPVLVEDNNKAETLLETIVAENITDFAQIRNKLKSANVSQPVLKAMCSYIKQKNYPLFTASETALSGYTVYGMVHECVLDLVTDRQSRFCNK